MKITTDGITEKVDAIMKLIVFIACYTEYYSRPLSTRDILQDIPWTVKPQIIPDPMYKHCYPTTVDLIIRIATKIIMGGVVFYSVWIC
jgi:hypothetical protein